jgi:hypothetical protein
MRQAYTHESYCTPRPSCAQIARVPSPGTHHPSLPKRMYRAYVLCDTMVTRLIVRHRGKHQNGKRVLVHDIQKDGELGCGESPPYIRIGDGGDVRLEEGKKPKRQMDNEEVGRIVLAVSLRS